MGRGTGSASDGAPLPRGKKTETISGAERYEEFKRSHLNVLYVSSNGEARQAAREIKKLAPKEISVDFETASKAGRFGSFNGSLRMVQLGFDEPERGIEPLQILLDLHSCEAKPFLPLLRTRNSETAIHYMDFEQEWSMLHLGTSIGQVYDTCIAGQVIQKKLKSMPLDEAQKLLPGWEPHNNKLSTLIERYVGLELPKENQASDWGRRNLTPDQIVYAAMDVATLPPLKRRLKQIAIDVGVEKDVDGRIAWVKRKIAERVERAKASNNDDLKRLARSIKRARTREEADRVYRASKQMTIIAENAQELEDVYKERRSELAA